MQDLLLNKTHNEARQGEAFAAITALNNTGKKHFYIESYGCAMNFADSEVVAAILQGEGFAATTQPDKADLILINTCYIREKAEMTVRKRLTEFRSIKKNNPGLIVGVLGCMAERLKSVFIEEEKLVDIVVGPDAYRSLPALIEEAGTGQKAVNVLREGRSPLIHTALGPSHDKGSALAKNPGARHRIGRALGQILRRLVEFQKLERVVIAGGDTSSHALCELDIEALTTLVPLPTTPGSPLCLAHGSVAATEGLEIALKGGQIGHDDYFSMIRNGG